MDVNFMHMHNPTNRCRSSLEKPDSDDIRIRWSKWTPTSAGSWMKFERMHQTPLLSSPLTMVLGKTLGLTQVLTRSVAKRDRRLKPVGASRD